MQQQESHHHDDDHLLHHHVKEKVQSKFRSAVVEMNRNSGNNDDSFVVPQQWKNSYRINNNNKANHHHSAFLLHGYLHIQIVEANFSRTRLAGSYFCGCCCCRRNYHPVVIIDPYVTVHAAGPSSRLFKTSFAMRHQTIDENDSNNRIVWKEDVIVPISHHMKHLELRVKDHRVGGVFRRVRSLGRTYLHVAELLHFDDNNDGKELRTGVHRVDRLSSGHHHGTLEYYVEYVPADLMLRRQRQLNAPYHVPGTYFAPRSGNRVKLYVDADVRKLDPATTMLPQVSYGNTNKKIWEAQRCWRDIYDCLVAAKHFIYIAGWSVDHTQSLLRGEELLETKKKKDGMSPYIGELLKHKANSGVVVNLLVWDDQTSTSITPTGLMGTQDEALRLYFANSKVNLHLVAIGSDGGTETKCYEKLRNAVIFTHHQKTIVCDDGNDSLAAFLGGIDLTCGRYDFGGYPLFRTLQTLHLGDFYNGCTPVARRDCGPRQPWHDIHMYVQGPAVYDILQNFEERWRQQAPLDVQKLVDIEKLGIDTRRVGFTGEAEGEVWTTQLFRSIDSRTAKFEKAILSQQCSAPSFDEIEGVTFGKRERLDSSKAKRKFLMHQAARPEYKRTFTANSADGFGFTERLRRDKGLAIDQSCQQALIHYIRTAEHVVYIENQYFLSSAHLWQSEHSTKCHNLVASELTWKICQKIESRQRFAAYIVLPMWPDGAPESHSVQEVLHWQHRTIEGMYQQIVKSIRRVKGKYDGDMDDAKPTDYLNFYCLANREKIDDGSVTPKSATQSEKTTSTMTRRHLVYVHSKMAIIDDAVAVVGSANINERSLAGTRDTEISQACWQPAHQATKDSIAQGDVHGFRLHCWSHITGRIEDVFRHPSGQDCVRRMNEIAENNWKLYTQEDVCNMDSFLMPYPIVVDELGKVRARTRNGKFPDTKARILGEQTILPKVLTT